MKTISIVLGESAVAEAVRAHPQWLGVTADYPRIIPVHTAFAPMIQFQRFDVCEMAIGAFLQAFQAGKPLLLLPVVMSGDFHHGNLYVAPGSSIIDPRGLVGKKIGVRSFSQTTALWVRGWLQEEFSVGVQDVTWMVNERSHVSEFNDPANVEFLGRDLSDAVKAGVLDAAVMGRTEAVGLRSLISDAGRYDESWLARHKSLPINHIVAVTSEIWQTHPNIICEIYRVLAANINSGKDLKFARAGMSPIRDAVALAADYALQQGMIAKRIEDIEALFVDAGG